MASPQPPTTMENLPDNVLSDIFIRLLAKQLAQMRSVCKSWNILLSESSFIKSHLYHSIHNKDNILLFYDWEFSFGCSPFTTRPSHSPRLELTNILNLPDNPHYKNTNGSWASISPPFPSHVRWLSGSNEVYADGRAGHLHWVCVTGLEWRKQTIVAFDLGTETFREIHLPDPIHHLRYVLGVLGGKLCVMSRVRGGEYEVMVMDDDEAWVKNLVFSNFSGHIFPYGFTLRNELLFEVGEDGGFALYDPTAANTKIFKIALGESLMKNVIEYVDSLVWITPSS